MIKTEIYRYANANSNEPAMQTLNVTVIIYLTTLFIQTSEGPLLDERRFNKTESHNEEPQNWRDIPHQLNSPVHPLKLKRRVTLKFPIMFFMTILLI